MSQVEDTINQLATLTSAFGNSADELATELGYSHPTLIGQVAKTIGLGVMRRSDHEYKPFNTYPEVCGFESRIIDLGSGQSFTLPAHAAHDARLDCTTVVGAELMARQSFI